MNTRQKPEGQQRATHGMLSIEIDETACWVRLMRLYQQKEGDVR